MYKVFPLWLVVLMLASCSNSQDVVQDGLFQKRKYFKKGWFVDKPVTRGMEELAVDETEVDQIMVRDPFLRAIPSQLATLHQVEDIQLEEIHLRTSEIPPVRTIPRSVPLSSKGSQRVIDRPVNTANKAVTSAVYFQYPAEIMRTPLLSTSVVILLPMALLILLLLIVQRLIRMNDNGSWEAMLALLMGVLGLTALAMF